MTLKIMHSADFHIGMTLNRYGPISSELAESRVAVLQKIVDKANEKECHLLTIAGDLFDKTSINKGDVEATIKKLHDFKGNAILILPGNHDHLSEGSNLWEWIRESLPDHGVVLDKKEPVSLTRFGLANVTVYPAPCYERNSNESAIDWIKEQLPVPDEVSIAIAHGALEGKSMNEGDYYPMTERELDEIEDMDLWLLGHVHRSFPDEENVRIQNKFYAGTPEPDGLDCRHQGSCWIIEIGESREIKAERLWIGQYRFEDKAVEIKDGNDIQKVISSYAERENTILRLKISGWIPKEDYDNWIRSGKLYSELKDNLAQLVSYDDNDLHPQIDRDVIDEEFTQASFPYQLLTTLESEGKETGLQAAYELIKEVQNETD